MLSAFKNEVFWFLETYALFQTIQSLKYLVLQVTGRKMIERIKLPYKS